MLTAIKKLGNIRMVPKAGPFSLTKQALPLCTVPKRNFAFKQEPDVTEEKPNLPEFNDEIQRLLAEKVTEIYNPGEMKEIMEKLFLETHQSPAEFKHNQLEKLKEYAGPNYKYMVNRTYTAVIDALKERTMQRVIPFNFQNNLDEYKFKDGYDYQVPDRADESKALGRLTTVELGNSYVQNKLKYVLEDDEHFSKHEDEYFAEDYLKDKPETFVAVFNIPADSTLRGLYKIFSAYGEIRTINLRRTYMGLPAFLEIVYATKEQALAAKSHQNHKMLKGKMLNVKTVEDREYEDPVNRTVVICGFNPHYQLQSLLEHLMNFGNVMHFEFPMEQRVNAKPTKEQLEHYIKTSNITESGKYKVTIQTKRYQMNGGHLTHTTTTDANGLETQDLRQTFSEDKLANKEYDDIMGEIEDSENREQIYYAKKFYSDPYEAVFEAADLSQFKTGYTNIANKELANNKEEPSLQYYLKSVEDIKSKVSKDSGLSHYQKVEVNNLVEAPYSRNKGYIFVTFSHTDEAKKAMINIPLNPLFANTDVTLKKNDGHMDWDAEYFAETYEKVRDNNFAAVNKIMDKQGELRDKQDLYQTVEEFKEKTFGENYEKDILNNPVKKRNIEVKRSPEEWIQYFQEEQAESENNIKEELESLYEARGIRQFSKKDVFEKKTVSDDEDSEYQVGRSFSKNVGDKDVANFERVLKNKKIQKEARLRAEGEDIQKDAIEELFRKVMTDEGVTSESPNLDRLRQQLQQVDPSEKMAKNIEHHEMMVEHMANKEIREEASQFHRQEQAKKLQEAAEKGRARREEGEEEEEEDMYYNPFQPVNEKKKVKLNNPTSSEDIDAKSRYLEKRQKHIDEVLKKYQGNYTKAEIQEDIEQTRQELKSHIKARHYFRETDKDGNPYITQEDEARFEEESLPEDPEERALQKKRLERFKQLEELNWHKELTKNSEAMNPVIDHMLTKGYPLDAFHFKPTDDCPTIDQFIDNMRAANPKYNYEKSIDEEGNEVVIKLIRDSIHSSHINITSEEELEKFMAELQTYLVENGISESEVQMTDFHGTEEEYRAEIERRQNLPATDMDEKILGLLLKKFPKEVVEEMLTGSAFSPTKMDETMFKLQQQAALKARIEENRALTKDDFVKYSSQVFNVRENNGKFKKSKYDIV